MSELILVRVPRGSHNILLFLAWYLRIRTKTMVFLVLHIPWQVEMTLVLCQPRVCSPGVLTGDYPVIPSSTRSGCFPELWGAPGVWLPFWKSHCSLFGSTCTSNHWNGHWRGFIGAWSMAAMPGYFSQNTEVSKTQRMWEEKAAWPNK